MGAIVTLELTDPGGASEPWRVQRQLLRTWTTMESCKTQKQGFIGYHIDENRGYGLVTPSGTSPVVETEKVECFVKQQ